MVSTQNLTELENIIIANLKKNTNLPFMLTLTKKYFAFVGFSFPIIGFSFFCFSEGGRGSGFSVLGFF